MTHASTTDRDTRLHRKTRGSETKLGYLGHVLMENRNDLVMEAEVTIASVCAERDAAIPMIDAIPGENRMNTA